MSAIKFFSAKQYSTKLKVTVQATGRLGFSDDTAKEMGLSSQTYIKLGSEDGTDELKYMVVLPEADDDAFKVCKAGDYYYLPIAVLLMSLGYDFRNKTIIFDLTRSMELDDELGGKVYKLNKRENEKRRKNDSISAR